MSRNKHPTKQRINTKKLLKYKNELEDCVQSQQKTIEELQSTIANNQLGHDLMKRKYEDMQKFVQLNRPEILQLMKSLVKHSATGGPTLDIKLVKAKRKAPKIPDAPNFEVKQPTLEEAKALRDQFYEQFPEVKKVLEKQVQKEVVAMVDAASASMKLNPIAIVNPVHAPRLPFVSAPVETARAEPIETWDPKTRKFVKEKPQ